MDATPIDRKEAKPIRGPLPGAGRPQFGQGSASALSMKWSALHDAASTVAIMAGVDPEPMSPEIRNFPAMMRDVGGWRKDLAAQGIDDLNAVMEPGILALLSAHARGVNSRPAANALLREFRTARDALLALRPDDGAITPRRSA